MISACTEISIVSSVFEICEMTFCETPDNLGKHVSIAFALLLVKKSVDDCVGLPTGPPAVITCNLYLCLDS